MLDYETAFAAFRSEALSTAVYRQFRPAPIPLETSFERPRHANRDLRTLIASAMPARSWISQALSPFVEQIVARARTRSQVEFVSEIATPLARAWPEVLLGLEPARAAELLALAHLAASEPGRAHRHAAGRSLRDGLVAEVGRRRAEPGPDLLSTMSLAWRDAEADDDDLAAFLGPIVFSATRPHGAQLATTTALAAAEHPEVPIADEMVRAAVREAARWEPVNTVSPRRVDAPLELGGAQLSPGEKVLIVLPAVCRDPVRHPAPDRFDPTRPETSLAFGLGEHRCLGQDLALTASETTVRQLLATGPLPTLDPTRPPKFDTDIGRACTELPLRFSASLP